MRLLMITILSSIVFLFGLTGCSSSSDSSNEKAYDSDHDAPASDDGIRDSAGFDGEAGLGDLKESENLSQDANMDRKVIYTGYIHLEVKNYQQTEAFIQEQVQKKGGYIIESSTQHRGDYEIYGHISVKVPAEHFHSFMNELETDQVKVLERDYSGNNVTEEYVDLQSRLRSKQAVEKRLLSFLDEATNTEDLLNISRDLADVQEQIEQLTGRINYLNNHINYSTINIYLLEKRVTVSTLKDSESLNTWENAKSLFMDTVNGTITFFSKLIVLIIGLSPLLLPATIILLIFLLRYKRKKKFTQNN